MGVTGYGQENGETRSAYGEMPLTLGTAALAGLILFLLMLLFERAAKKEGPAVTKKEGPSAAKKEGPSVAEREGSSAAEGKHVQLLTVWEQKVGLMCTAVSGVFLYIASPWFPSEWLCETFEVIGRTLGGIQYSWRLLTVAALMLSVVLTIVIRALVRLHSSRADLLAGALGMLILLAAVEAGTEYYGIEPLMEDKFDGTIYWNFDYALSFVQRSEVEPWIMNGEGPKAAEGEDEDDSGLFAVSDYQRQGTDYEFSYVNLSGEDLVVSVPVYWYGLHTAYLTDDLTGETQEIVLEAEMNETNQFTDIILPGDVEAGTVSLRYEEPLLWRAADAVSLIAALALILVLSARGIYSKAISRMSCGT